MTMNLRVDDTFVQDEGWYAAASRYADFLRRHHGQRVLFWELGVGGNTPVSIKSPFWQMTRQNRNAVYACINRGESFVPRGLRRRGSGTPPDWGAAGAVRPGAYPYPPGRKPAPLDNPWAPAGI